MPDRVRPRRLLLALICLIAAAAPAAASAATPEFTASEAEVALHEAKAALAGSAGAVDASFALRNLALALPALNDADRSRARGILARPTESSDRNYFGPEADESPLCTANFCVHWTDREENAPVDDAFVDEVAAAAEQSYAVENGTLGWQEAKSDGKLGARGGIGGEGQTDIYITNLGRGLYGFATPDVGQKGAKRFAYLVLDNNYVGFPSPPLDSMRVTVAHEYNHILQFNYDLFQDLWMFEATATWVEQHVYPDLDDYLNYLPAFAKTPQTPLTGDDIEIYAEAVWNHWLSSRYSTDVVREAWEGSRSADPKSFAPAAYEVAIRNLGGKSFSQEFGDFAAATAEWRSAIFSFPDATVYPNMRREGTLGSRSRKLALDNTSYRLYDVKPAGASAQLQVKAPSGVRSTIALVGRTGPDDSGAVTVRSKFLPKGGRGSVRIDGLAGFTRVTALVINGDARRGANRTYKADNSAYRAKLVR